MTRLGRFFRSTSIDELPQLWNVLRGEMSLVGPRPLPCDETAACRGWLRRRLDVTPGLTCFWQVRGPLDGLLCRLGPHGRGVRPAPLVAPQPVAAAANRAGGDFPARSFLSQLTI